MELETSFVNLNVYAIFRGC